jgi:HPt (histidine-containing phosphotransfer) domain-containing protein
LVALSDDLTLPLLQVRASLDLLKINNFNKASARLHAHETELNIDIGLQLAEAYRLLLNSDELNKLLRSALEVLSSSLIRAQTAQGEQKTYNLLLGAHRNSDNSIATGVFSTVNGLSDKTLRAARSLVGKARQPLPTVPPGAAAGILIADLICASMWQPLRAAAHNNLTGLATSIPASRQLQFV